MRKSRRLTEATLRLNKHLASCIRCKEADNIPIGMCKKGLKLYDEWNVAQWLK